MSEEFIEIEGIEETCRMLDEAPREVMPIALARGLEAGGRVIEREIAIRTPQREGELFADLDLDIRIDTNGQGGQALAGFGKQGYKAGWVEYGHRMIGHKPEKKDLGVVEPHPFMRPAGDAAAEPALEAFEDAVMEELATGEVVDAA